MDVAGIAQGAQRSEIAMAALAQTMRAARDQGQALAQLIADTPPASPDGIGRLVSVRV